MCDTMVALPGSTADGSVIFAKNSDRYPNESQHIEFHPAADHPGGSTLKCTYIEIPQVEHTYAVFLCRPFWMWGAEMGVNEHGVVIGNQAIFSKVPPVKEPRLPGMDLIRLGLERGDSARNALDTITTLLETYGQGGNCSYRHSFYYHNSFIIADKHEAYILETIDRLWVAKKVEQYRSISNVLSINSQWDIASENFIGQARSRGMIRNNNKPDVAKCFSDKLFTWGACSKQRQARSSGLLAAANGEISVGTMMNILRDHNSDTGASFLGGLFNKTLCAHAGWGPARKDTQSTGSLIVRLTEDDIEIWVTGTSAPCISLFKPVWFEGGLPDTGPEPRDRFDSASLWWKHEVFHRLTLRDYEFYRSLSSDELYRTQDNFIRDASSIDRSKRKEFTTGCFSQAEQLEEKWTEQIKSKKPLKRQPLLVKVAWKKFNKESAIKI